MSAQWLQVHDLLTELSDEECLEMDRYSPRPVMSTYRLRRAVEPMSDQFLTGYPEKLTRAEKRSYKKDKWL